MGAGAWRIVYRDHPLGTDRLFGGRYSKATTAKKTAADMMLANGWTTAWVVEERFELSLEPQKIHIREP